MTPDPKSRTYARAAVEPHDAVLDPLDGRWRIVVSVSNTTAHMADGGHMGVDECAATPMLLPSEYERVGDYARPLTPVRAHQPSHG